VPLALVEVVVAGCKAFDGGWVGSATKAQISKVVVRAWVGAVAAVAPTAEGVYTCVGWNTCAGAKGWKDWW
jgi:hypothetical protein